jgi:hypothetical protein
MGSSSRVFWFGCPGWMGSRWTELVLGEKEFWWFEPGGFMLQEFEMYPVWGASLIPSRPALLRG